jgi:hypothetical protein
MRTIPRQTGLFGGEIELPSTVLAFAANVFGRWHALARGVRICETSDSAPPS